MLDLKKIAVTGAVASGKSTVCNIFKNLNAYVVDSDKLVHQLLDIHTHLGKQITELLGPEIVENDQLNRKKISQIVFQDLGKLAALETLIHPTVLQEIKDQYEDVRQKHEYSSFVVEIPLLFETRTELFYDAIILVTANTQICKERSGFEELEYQERMARQLPSEIKKEKAHYVLQNNGTLQQLEETVKAIHSKIRNGGVT